MWSSDDEEVGATSSNGLAVPLRRVGLHNRSSTAVSPDPPVAAAGEPQSSLFGAASLQAVWEIGNDDDEECHKSNNIHPSRSDENDLIVLEECVEDVEASATAASFASPVWRRRKQTVKEIMSDVTTVMTTPPSYDDDEDDSNNSNHQEEKHVHSVVDANIILIRKNSVWNDQRSVMEPQQAVKQYQKFKQIRRRRLFCQFILAMGTVVTTLTLLITLISQDPGHPAVVIRTAEQQQRLDEARQFLVMARISRAEDLPPSFDSSTGTGTPQTQALYWMMMDDEWTQSVAVPTALFDESLDTLLFVQRYVLAVLYFATGGSETWDHATNDLHFLSNVHECEWHAFTNSTGNTTHSPSLGVFCGEDRLVNKIDMTNHGLTGQLPLEFFELRQLNFVSLAHNALEQPMLEDSEQVSFPNDNMDILWRSLRRLEYLNLQSNNFYGPLPTGLGDLPNLQVLVLSNNHFRGRLYPEALPHTSLFALDVSGNELVGEIPTNVWNLPRLSYLLLHNNTFHTVVTPTTVLGANKLEMVTLFDNPFLTGSLQGLCDGLSVGPSAEPTMFWATDCGTTVDCPCCITCCPQEQSNGSTTSEEGECFQEELEQVVTQRSRWKATAMVPSNFPAEPGPSSHSP